MIKISTPPVIIYLSVVCVCVSVWKDSLWGAILSMLFQDHRNLGNHGALNFGCCVQSPLNGEPMAVELIELMFQGWRS
jgi:hypothetical protein